MASEPKLGVNRGNAGKGRPKGSPNKTTALLKDAILQAATEAGGGDLVAYLKMQASLNPGPFMTLLGKVMPTQVEAEVDHRVDSLAALLEVVAQNGRKITDR